MILSYPELSFAFSVFSCDSVQSKAQASAIISRLMPQSRVAFCSGIDFASRFPNTQAQRNFARAKRQKKDWGPKATEPLRLLCTRVRGYATAPNCFDREANPREANVRRPIAQKMAICYCTKLGPREIRAGLDGEICP